MKKDSSVLKEYSYDVPSDLIASVPATPRDSSRLLVYETRHGSLTDSVFKNISDFIPRGALLVMNETKVVPARIILTKKTGGRAEILFYINEWDMKSERIQAISDRKLSPGDALFYEGEEICKVIDQKENLFTLSLSLSPENLLKLLEENGSMPIPKYIKGKTLSENDLRTRYQTVFAKNTGSIAAPTASLHFTPEVFASLKEKGVNVAYLTLHVGAGTFAPVTEKEISSRKLHRECFMIPSETKKAITEAKAEKRPIIAVGTTALRALESAAIDSAAQETELFIKKPYNFRVADGLLTNFHVPQSSLMCLVDAFLDFKKPKTNILDMYRYAIEKRYRFFSFGDAMLII